MDQLWKESVSRAWGQLQHPTSWVVCPTPENLPAPKDTPGSTSASHGNSRPTGSKIPPSDKKRPSPWELCTPSSPRHLPPPTPEPTTSPTWSPLTSASASGPVNYTKCTGHRRTVQFRPLMDFVFFVGDSHPRVYRPPLVTGFVVDLPSATRTAFLRDLNAAQESVQAGTTQDVIQQRLYR